MRAHHLTGLAVALLAAGGLLTGAPAGLTLTDVTSSAGISFVHNNGAFGGRYFPEELGSGAIVLDADADGWQDLLLVTATRWPGHPGKRSTPALYRNRGDGSFADISKGSGLDVEMYGVGGSAADYDNDGRTDVFISAYGGGRLFRGLGNGRFEAAAGAGIADQGWSTGAMWIDYDRDGWLDLFVARYVEWDPGLELHCTQNGRTKGYCSPTNFKPTSPRLYRNRRDGSFEDVTAKAGMATPVSRGLGVSMLDYDKDGWMDIFQANDLQPNQLFRNRGNGTFDEVARRAGVAVSEQGTARAGMGTDAADYDGSGWPSIVIGNFANEMMGLYHNDGKGLFIDEGPRSEVGRVSLLSLTFACFFFDVDLDGWLDIFAANGHVFDELPEYNTRITYRQSPHLFRNLGAGRFEEFIRKVGPDLARPIVGRGAAHVDFDRDGDLDLVVTENAGPARLYRNDGGNRNQSVRVRTVGTTSNRSGIGARVDVVTASGRRAWHLVRTGSSFASQSDPAVTFGLGADGRVSDLRVTWPTGRTESLGRVDAGQEVIVTEGKGITSRIPFQRGAR